MPGQEAVSVLRGVAWLVLISGLLIGSVVLLNYGIIDRGEFNWTVIVGVLFTYLLALFAWALLTGLAALVENVAAIRVHHENAIQKARD